MTLYGAYGLRLASAIDLPELPPASSGVVDVTIERRALPPLAEAGGDAMRFGGDAAHFEWRAVGRFAVSRDAVLVDPHPGVGDDLVAFPLLGPVLATLLHLRGLFVLHAGAVAIDGRATVLMGAKGAGKSTTATALAGAGHRLLADDIVAIEGATSGDPRVLPGFAQTKLSPEALAALSPAGERRADAHPAIDKVRLRLAQRPVATAVPLECICTLQRGDVSAFAVHARPPADALRDVLAHSYMARFGDAALFGPARAAHLAAAAALAARPGTATLRVPDRLDALRAAASRPRRTELAA